MSDPINKPVDIDAILMRLHDLELKAKEMDSMKKEIGEIKEITSTGLDVATEVQNELLADAAELKKNNIVIPFIEKQVEEIEYQEKKKAGRRPNVILESEILRAQSLTNSAIKAAKKLGVNYLTYRKYCRIYGIFKKQDVTSKRENRALQNPYKGKYPLPRILNGECPNFPIHRLKDKLIRSGMKKTECELCGFHERRITDGKIPLLLNFEDGDRYNHKIENLKIYCYNCTFTSGRGYIKRGTVNFNMDPDIMQGAKYPLKARF